MVTKKSGVKASYPLQGHNKTNLWASMGWKHPIHELYRVHKIIRSGPVKATEVGLKIQ